MCTVDDDCWPMCAFSNRIDAESREADLEDDRTSLIKAIPSFEAPKGTTWTKHRDAIVSSSVGPSARALLEEVKRNSYLDWTGMWFENYEVPLDTERDW